MIDVVSLGGGLHPYRDAATRAFRICFDGRTNGP
jgi:hypothetical protein